MGVAQDATAPLITVRGEASAEADPELAQLTVVLRADGADRQDVLRRIAERDRGCAGLIGGYGAAIERCETSPLTVHPNVREGFDGDRTGPYLGTLTLTITVADFAVLGELVVRLAGLGHEEIHGPRWMLPPASGVHRRTRQAAARDAVARGREYAEALGCRLVRLVEFTDTELTTTPISCLSYLDTESLAEEDMFQTYAALPLICIVPERQCVHAQVTARFATTAPDTL